MDRITREKATIRQMVELYCRSKERNDVLCDACHDLLDYACKRLEACRYGSQKCSCKSCATHCYATRHRDKIREIMRYAGPRMLWHHPLAALRHLINP